jgi:dipeptidyl aminopeptidase/acylaminoacyl peptidase
MLVKKSISLALLLVTAFSPLMLNQAQAAMPTIIPRDVLFTKARKLNTRISPDGKKIAYLAPYNGILNVWVRTVGQNDDHVVTASPLRDIDYFLWQPDSKNILFIRDRDGRESWHLFQTNLDTKVTRDLTPFEGVRAEVIAIRPNVPDKILVAMNLRDSSLMDVYQINLNNGVVELDTQNPGDVFSWKADNNLQVRAASYSLPDGGIEVKVRDDKNAPWRSLQKWGPDESFGGIFGFSPDNNSLWIASSIGANAARLMQVDLATGKSKVVTQDKQFDVDDILVQPKTGDLDGVYLIKQRSELIPLSKSVADDLEIIKKNHPGDIHVSSRDLEDDKWIVTYVVDDGPVLYSLFDRTNKQFTPLFVNNTALADFQLSKMEPISFKARDGMTIYGYLTFPAGVEPKNLPMILLVHGGPWNRDKWGLNHEVQWLANRGYAVMTVNYRGSTGFGKDYQNAGNKEFGNKMQSDLLDAKNWAVKMGYANPSKIGIMGTGYGGYATLSALAFNPDEFACGIDWSGPSNLITFLESFKARSGPLQTLIEQRVGDINKDRPTLEARSPIFKAAQIKAPLMVVQGANDHNVRKEESDRIVEAVRKNGRPVEYIVFPDEGRTINKPENALKLKAAIESFLGQYLGGQVQTASEAEKWDSVKQ